MGISAINIRGIVILILMVVVLFFAIKRLINKWFNKH